jgi:spore coat polysaccharide biosynthesis predicted glycosyltransferase SpsG
MILLLTEAGTGIGFGHLTRMMAVGDGLIAAGAPVFMLVQWEGPPAEGVVEGRSWVNTGVWRENSVVALRALGAAAVLVDSYRLGLEGYEAVAGSGAMLAVMDDCYRLPFPADLVINPNVYADVARYLPSAKDAVGGLEHVILRVPVAQARGTFEVREKLKRVLLMLGGSDVHGLGLSFANAIAAVGYEVDWIAPDQSDGMALHDGVTLTGPVGARELVRLVLVADLVICGGGQTLHELACLGAPCVAIELGEDQKLNLSFYEKTGWLGPRLSWSQADIVATVVQRVGEMDDVVRRTGQTALVRDLVDGQGPRRIAERLLDRL